MALAKRSTDHTVARARAGAGYFLYGYARSPDFHSFGYTTMRLPGPANCSRLSGWTSRNCTISTRLLDHSPFLPNLTSPTTVLKVVLCMYAASFAWSRL